MLPISIVTYRLPKLQHVASIHLLIYPKHRWGYRSGSVVDTTHNLHQPLPSNAYSRD